MVKPPMLAFMSPLCARCQVASFAPDNEYDPVFKELWCKKGPPSREFVAKYTPQPSLPLSPPPPPPPVPAAQLSALIDIADRLGPRLHNSHQVRQFRVFVYVYANLPLVIPSNVSSYASRDVEHVQGVRYVGHSSVWPTACSPACRNSHQVRHLCVCPITRVPPSHVLKLAR